MGILPFKKHVFASQKALFGKAISIFLQRENKGLAIRLMLNDL